MSGTTGFDYGTMAISSGVWEQAEQAIRNISQALAEADNSLADVVRIRCILPDRAESEPCWPVLRGRFGEARPATTVIVAGLADPR